MVSVGETFTATVKDISSAGQGIVEHASGRVFFVSGVWFDELVTVKVTSIKSRFGQARLVKIDTPSAERRDGQLCKHHGFSSAHCGGCPWLFVDDDAQLRAKQKRVVSSLERLGIDAASIKPIMGSDATLAYRNRAQFKSDGKRLGYLAAGSRQLVDVEHCPVLSVENAETLKASRAQLPNSHWRVSKKSFSKKKPQWTTLNIDDSMPGEVLINKRLPFRQGNSGQNSRMQEWLHQTLASFSCERSYKQSCERSNEKSNESARASTVLELFCGSGNFTEVISAFDFESIIAVEGDDGAIATLTERHLSGVTALTKDLYSDSAYAYLLKQYRPSILVMDPPRDGLKAPEKLFAPKSSIQHIVYISCDLATFSRDTAVILDRGFIAKDIQPIDLFPQTPHVELLAYFSREA